MMILWTLAGLTGWSLAGALHDTRQSKRLFPLYGAGLVVGLVAGGFLTSPLAAALGTEQLVFVWAGGTLAAAWLARSAARRGPPRAVRGRASRPPGITAGWRAVRGSALLRWMGLSIALFALAFFVLSFLFARTVAARYPEAERLAGFLGVFFGAATGTALLVSLFATNRLFARIGTVNAVLGLAVLYVLGFTGLALFSSFLLVAAARFIQVVWVNAVWAPGWQSLFNVVPGERRGAVRAFFDAVPLQVGIVLAGALLLVAEGNLSPRAIAAGAAGAAAVVLFSMWRARTAYVHALGDALREGNPEVFLTEASPLAGTGPDRAAVAAAVAASEDPDVSVRRIGVEILADTDAPEVLPALLARLDDEDPEVRRSALRGAARDGDARAREALEAMLAAADGERGFAAMALAEADAWAPAAALAAMEDADPGVRAAAARALGAAPTETALPPLLDALADPDERVRAQAARALGRLGPDAVQPLFEMLDDRDREPAALDALNALPGLDVRRLAPYARDRARSAARVAGWARALAGRGEATALLVAALEERARANGAAALRALAPGSPDALRVVLDNLWSADADQRANAVEMLDAAATPDVARLLLGALEAVDERTADPGVALSECLADADPWLRASAAVAAAEAPERERLAPLLKRVAGSDPEPFVRDAAAAALGGPRNVETLATLSVMDRVVVLRRVPLFAALSGADLGHVAEAATEHAFEDGDVIAAQGERGDSLHMLVSGEIVVVMAEPGGTSRELATRRAGEYVGEMALIGGEPRMASLVARGKVRTLSLDRPRFERIVRERPEASLAVMRVLGERLREASS
jgi:HEAT repeat protein